LEDGRHQTMVSFFIEGGSSYPTTACFHSINVFKVDYLMLGQAITDHLYLPLAGLALNQCPTIKFSEAMSHFFQCY
jgi:hypothetical protein